LENELAMHSSEQEPFFFLHIAVRVGLRLPTALFSKSHPLKKYFLSFTT
jgi:hypothetical protein